MPSSGMTQLKETNRELLIEYGTANALTESNMQGVGWALDAWSIGTDGVLPWQVLGRDKSWQEADARRGGQRRIALPRFTSAGGMGKGIEPHDGLVRLYRNAHRLADQLADGVQVLGPDVGI